MSSDFGHNLHISLFGQSHSEAIGVVIDGLRAGEAIDIAEINQFLARRAPGRNLYSSARNESDHFQILSGLKNGYTCGSPLCAIIKNEDARSDDYEPFKNIPRPGHADYPAAIKYAGLHDLAGGGHFSGRLTAPLCIAGAICIQLLRRRGVSIGAHLASIGAVDDISFDPVKVCPADFVQLQQKQLPVLDDAIGEGILDEIKRVAEAHDSIGGIVECCALGLPVGLGEPMFRGLENQLAAATFAIPAVKGIEFGTGFAGARMRGSANNDPWCYTGDRVMASSNNHGGILGGLSTGMPLIMRVAFKPTSSIGQEQNTVDLLRRENCRLSIQGRHDPCIAIRAVPIVEAAMALVLMDFMICKDIK